MPLKYNGKKIIPAPSVGIQKEYVKTGDGKKVGSLFNITLEGHLIPHMGSPTSEGVFQTGHGEPNHEPLYENKIQYSLFKKTEALRDLFSTDGKLLEISSQRLFNSTDDNDAPAISGFARVIDIDFPVDLYHTVLPYTINLQIDELMCQKIREENVNVTICEDATCADENCQTVECSTVNLIATSTPPRDDDPTCSSSSCANIQCDCFYVNAIHRYGVGALTVNNVPINGRYCKSQYTECSKPVWIMNTETDSWASITPGHPTGGKSFTDECDSGFGASFSHGDFVILWVCSVYPGWQWWWFPGGYPSGGTPQLLAMSQQGSSGWEDHPALADWINEHSILGSVQKPFDRVCVTCGGCSVDIYNPFATINWSNEYLSGRMVDAGDTNHDAVPLFTFPPVTTVDSECDPVRVNCLEQADYDALSTCIGSEGYSNAASAIVAESGQAFVNMWTRTSGQSWEQAFAAQNPDRIFLTEADESWDVSDNSQIKGVATYSVSGPAENRLLTVNNDNSPMFNLSHTVSAKGRRAYDSNGLIREPWQNSKMWVDARLGIPSGDASYALSLPVDVQGVSQMFKLQPMRDEDGTGNVNRFSLTDDDGDASDLIDYSAYDYSRSHNIDKTTGDYSITEKWTLAKTEQNANVIEDINTELQNQQDSDKVKTITVNGQLTGLESKNMSLVTTQSKYEAALERYNYLTTGQHDVSAITDFEGGNLFYLLAKNSSLHTISGIKAPFVTKTVSHNEEEGSISFTYSFNNREQTIVGKSISETISVDIKEAEDQYAIIPILGRSAEPVIQSLNTPTAYEATVNAEIIMGDEYRSEGPPAITETAGSLWAKVWPPPDYTLYSLVLMSQSESWDPVSGTFSRTKTYRWLSSYCPTFS